MDAPHTQVSFADCTDRSGLTFDGDHYQLLNVHIHSMSEHEVSLSTACYLGTFLTLHNSGMYCCCGHAARYWIDYLIVNTAVGRGANICG